LDGNIDRFVSSWAQKLNALVCLKRPHLPPRGTPPAVVQTLHRAIEKACQGPELIEKLTNIGGDVVCNRPEEFAATIRSDVQRWRQVVRDAAIHID
jgi:tripartite-type tricarboxylate transporter receptor subunit TctC